MVLDITAGDNEDSGTAANNGQVSSTPNHDDSPFTSLSDPDLTEEVFDVNTVIEEVGWGSYQRRIVLVMGVMSLADAAEIWLATVILNNLQCEWELSSAQKALIPAIVYLFYAIGSCIAGKLADQFGRFPVLLFNGYLIVISAVTSALAPSYSLFICCRALTGLGIGASYGCSIVYTTEVVPTVKRSWGIMIMECFWLIGGFYECGVAYFVMDLENGWRIQILITALPCMIMLIMLHFIDESPRYLVINGKQEKAMEVVSKMSRVNGKETPSGKIFCSDERSGGFGDVWAAPLTWGSVQITIHFFCNMFLVFGVPLLVPDMMYKDYCGMGTNSFNVTYINDEGCEVFNKTEYIFLMVMSISYAPGIFTGTAFSEAIGRRWSFIISVYSGAMFTFLLLICADNYLTYFILFACSSAYVSYNQTLWIYTPEFYPTYMRGTAIGVQNGIGKFGASVGSFLTTYLNDIGIRWTVLSYICINIVACVTAWFMKKETKGQALEDQRPVSESTRLYPQSSTSSR